MDLSQSQLIFRNAVMNYIDKDGYSTFVGNQNNCIVFSRLNTFYWIQISGTSPFHLLLQRIGPSFDEISRERAISIINVQKEQNSEEIYDSNDTNLKIGVEITTYSLEEFKTEFYKSMHLIDDAMSRFQFAYALNNMSSSGISITDVKIANADASGKLIFDYDHTIFSYASQFIKSKLNISVRKAGSYQICVKFFPPNDILSVTNSSPSGYSYSNSVNLIEGNNVVELSGWGSSRSGQWKAGVYRCEYYSNNQLLFMKRFTIE